MMTEQEIEKLTLGECMKHSQKVICLMAEALIEEIKNYEALQQKEVKSDHS